ncbi:MAG TPA: hypothetical protein VHB97_03925 [Polyangia bacterium]|jgi:hypothetical protein|nr:hypothetical protein [Polyangia bacterium]
MGGFLDSMDKLNISMHIGVRYEYVRRLGAQSSERTAESQVSDDSGIDFTCAAHSATTKFTVAAHSLYQH